ncbi:hypothetical protein IFM89_014289 [Coptis chinensis]|uniref:Uncharacterized protein n=1 Tax=Coptis chinensis TaxID=261450 RepID=A0A835HSX8_9MAGN|nr:hypothetical protein IFM89_014289 [Coptis chinensis]
MDLINNFLNIVALPATFFTLLMLVPPFLFFKFLLSTLKSIFFSENVAGKVVLITGASSGIGENLAYQYAKQGAFLVLVARRKNSLQEVAERAYQYGSPDVLVIHADVAKIDDCRRMVEEAVNHFGRSEGGISLSNELHLLPSLFGCEGFRLEVPEIFSKQEASFSRDGIATTKEAGVGGNNKR